MIISLATVKKLMFQELQRQYESALETDGSLNDVQRAFIHIGYREALKVLESAQDESGLRDYLQMMDYGMSITDWLESL